MNQAKKQIPSRLKHSNMLLLTRVHTHSMFQVSPLRTYVQPLTQVCTGTVQSHTHLRAYTLHTFMQCKNCPSSTQHTSGVPPHTRVGPWEEDGERSPERIESPTYWPPSDPFHSVGEGPARSKRMGWGWGDTTLPAAGTLHACAHTFAGGVGGYLRQSPPLGP